MEEREGVNLLLFNELSKASPTLAPIVIKKYKVVNRYFHQKKCIKYAISY